MIFTLLFASFLVDIVALVAVLLCLIDAIADMRVVQRFGYVNGRRIVAWADVRGQAIRLATIMVMGALVMLVIPVVDEPSDPNLTSIVIFSLFTTIHLLMAANAVMDLGMRRRLARESDEAHKARAADAADESRT